MVVDAARNSAAERQRYLAPAVHEWIDGHLDLAYIHQGCGDIRTAPQAGEQRCVSLPGLLEGRYRLIAATIFIEPGVDPSVHPWGYGGPDDIAGAQRAARAQLEIYESLERAGLVRIIRTRADLHARGPLGLVLLMEGADPIADASDAPQWFERGVRMVGLTWARGTRHAGGNAQGGGLSARGRELVAALDDLGIVHDASHLSDAAFDDLAAATDRVIVASHSNARALIGGGQRHITDAQIREISRRGGVVGLNLYGRFLVPAAASGAESVAASGAASGAEPSRRATIDDAVAHIEHVAAVAGRRDCCVLGSDLDGGFAPSEVPRGLESPQRARALAPALAGRLWSDEDCAGFASGNWMRVFERSLPAG